MKNTKQQMITDAARLVFLKYGFKRVTMSDIAEAAGISRPAVYLIFPNKEDVFKAVIKDMVVQNLQKIKVGVKNISSLQAKLMFVFETWSVQPYELIRRSPDFKELIECGQSFAKEIYDWAGAELEVELMSILKSSTNQKSKANYSPKILSRMMRNAARGFKEGAKDISELRKMLKDFLDIVIFAIEA
jgi:AcrR family transcriptional regulator